MQKYFNPAIIRSLGEAVPALAEAALKAFAEHGKTLLPLISEADMTGKAVPAVCRLAVNSAHLSTRVHALKVGSSTFLR